MRESCQRTVTWNYFQYRNTYNCSVILILSCDLSIDTETFSGVALPNCELTAEGQSQSLRSDAFPFLLSKGEATTKGFSIDVSAFIVGNFHGLRSQEHADLFDIEQGSGRLAPMWVSAYFTPFRPREKFKDRPDLNRPSHMACEWEFDIENWISNESRLCNGEIESDNVNGHLNVTYCLFLVKMYRNVV